MEEVNPLLPFYPGALCLMTQGYSYHILAIDKCPKTGLEPLQQTSIPVHRVRHQTLFAEPNISRYSTMGTSSSSLP